LVSIFHPTFLVSHLSRSSVSTLTADLYAPKDLVHNIEHTIDFTFHFGSPIRLDVCTFTPRDPTALRSYQTPEGKEDLVVQDSLPIALNLFTLELQAAEIDAWLDSLIDSESGLSEYVALMLRRHPGEHSAQILKSLVSWYLASKNELSEPAHQIVRTALKILMTTTLFTLVPKVTNIPESLSNCLSSPSPQPATHISPDAPKLLTRQIKASIFYLQQQRLCALFHHFGCATELPAEVKVAVALLVALVLDLVRGAGRQFAKHASAMKVTVEVGEKDVVEYETNMQTQVFDRVHASVLDVAVKTGGLGEQLRNLGSMVKGKENPAEDGEFLSAILHTVL
jgi:hypothetical protein